MKWILLETKHLDEPLWYVVVVQSTMKPITGEAPYGPYRNEKDAIAAMNRLREVQQKERLFG